MPSQPAPAALQTGYTVAMRALLRYIPVLFGLYACAAPADDSAASSGFDPDPTTTLGGDRPAEVLLPADYDVSREYPLVILLHGYGVNSDIQDVIFGLAARVDTLGYILVKPEGTEDSGGSQFWNATEECCDFERSRVDDVGYLTGLIDEARATYPVSTVSLVGHSNGGYMSYRMACEVPERIHRIAVLAGAVYKDESDCAGTDPVSVLHIHGTDDESVSYDSNPAHAGAVESVERWSTKAGCDAEPATLGTRDYLSNVDGEETTAQQWQGCADGIDVQLWTAAGADHTFIGARNSLRDDVAAWAIQ